MLTFFTFLNFDFEIENVFILSFLASFSVYSSLIIFYKNKIIKEPNYERLKNNYLPIGFSYFAVFTLPFFNWIFSVLVLLVYEDSIIFFIKNYKKIKNGEMDEEIDSIMKKQKTLDELFLKIVNDKESIEYIIKHKNEQENRILYRDINDFLKKEDSASAIEKHLKYNLKNKQQNLIHND